jgi:hypothetical protein
MEVPEYKGMNREPSGQPASLGNRIFFKNLGTRNSVCVQIQSGVVRSDSDTVCLGSGCYYAVESIVAAPRLSRCPEPI